jgi:hypothetical protein
MKKYNFLLAVIILISMSLFVNFSVKVNGFKLKIINDTNITIEGLKFEFEKEEKIIDIPKLSSKKFIDLFIETNDISTETILSLVYFDKNGQKKYKTVVPYLEKGYSGKGTIKIISIDELGHIEFDVNITSYYL